MLDSGNSIGMAGGKNIVTSLHRDIRPYPAPTPRWQDTWTLAIT